MDALQASAALAEKWSRQLGYVRGMSIAARLVSESGNQELANRLYMLAFETERAHKSSEDAR